MANSKLNKERSAYASIDTAPGADGYWSDSVSMTSKNTKALFFSQSGGGEGTVSLQYQLNHTAAAWTDYVTTETFEDGVRFRLDDFAAGVKWRAGIKNAGYTSGTVVCGFDW